MKYDAAIIGCGPGGMEASRILAEAGRKIAVIENSQWGGVCLNKGCIPTKMMLAAAAPLEAARSLGRFGELSGSLKVEYAASRKRIERYVGASSRSIPASLAALGATIYDGRAEAISPSQIRVTGRDGKTDEIDCEILIIATGSKPAFFPALAPDHQALLDSDDLLALDYIPESLCVIGAGAIGLEFASFFASCGTQITIVEAAERLSPGEDADIGDELKKILSKRGYKIFTNAKPKELRNDRERAVLALEDGTRIEADKALIAVGRLGSARELNASVTGCRFDNRDFIIVDDCLMAAKNVYAIGDCNGKTLLAHAAMHQGAYAARRILGEIDEKYSSGPIPSCVYGSVEIARAGLTAREAAKKGSVEISVSRLVANPVAQARAETEGFVKAVWLNGCLAGMSAIGGGVSNLVTGAGLLVAGDYTPEKLNGVMIAHPSLDEALGAAIRQKRVPYGAE